MRSEHAKVRSLLTDTITLLCKSGLAFSARLQIQGVIGVTVDQDVFVVHIDELFGDSELCESTRSDPSSSSLVDEGDRHCPPAGNLSTLSPSSALARVKAKQQLKFPTPQRLALSAPPRVPPSASTISAGLGGESRKGHRSGEGYNGSGKSGVKPEPEFVDLGDEDDYGEGGDAEDYNLWGQEDVRGRGYLVKQEYGGTEEYGKFGEGQREIKGAWDMDGEPSTSWEQGGTPSSYSSASNVAYKLDHSFSPTHRAAILPRHKSTRGTRPRGGGGDGCTPARVGRGGGRGAGGARGGGAAVQSNQDTDGFSYGKLTVTNYVCNICGVQYKHQCNLLTHQVRVHGREKKRGFGRRPKALDPLGGDGGLGGGGGQCEFKYESGQYE